KVDALDAALVQRPDVEHGGLAVAERHAYARAHRIVVDRTEAQAVDAAPAPSCDRRLAVAPAFEALAAERDPVVGIVVGLVGRRRSPAEETRPDDHPVGAALPFAAEAPDIGGDVDLAAVALVGAAGERDVAHAARSAAQVDLDRAVVAELARKHVLL